jgi:hypothetical protein
MSKKLLKVANNMKIGLPSELRPIEEKIGLDLTQLDGEIEIYETWRSWVTGD